MKLEYVVNEQTKYTNIRQVLIQEFSDRYGKVKDEILLYIEAKYLEHLLKISGIEFFKETIDVVKLSFNEEKSQSMSAKYIYQVVSNFAPKFKLDYINLLW